MGKVCFGPVFGPRMALFKTFWELASANTRWNPLQTAERYFLEHLKLVWDQRCKTNQLGPLSDPHVTRTIPILAQGSEVPSLGTFSGTLSGKWAKVGKMGGNGGK